MDKKLKSATIIETVVALLILMISFSAGMVIYNRIIDTGINDQKLRAASEMEFIADSLVSAGSNEDKHILRSGQSFEVKYKTDERYPGLRILSIVCIDDNGKIIAESLKLIVTGDEDGN